MKIRQGFVSNSSSTSFCIYGIHESGERNDLRALEEKADSLRLYCILTPGDGLYIGRKWSTVKDNETGRQFKESTQEKINQLPIENKKCEMYEESWCNG